ncbi:MAG TPA: pteridine-dependent deoxygenase like protein [Gammaproteobacteria bacterium]|nr:pteridine-dependent deoxygenase like protein [Gammaproteobacteria bacterium]
MPRLTCRYSTEPAERLLQSERVLAVVDFSAAGQVELGARYINPGLPLLSPEPWREVWRCDAPVVSGLEGGCHWSHSDAVLLLARRIEEGRGQDLGAAVRDAYGLLLGQARARGFPHVLRIWNYFAHINQGEGDGERYKRFCVGRAQAFEAAGYAEAHYPAASAIGHGGGDGVIYLLAAQVPPRHFENPQQVSAYRYPRCYGPRSPSFARATLLESRGGAELFLSGTASVVGHRTLHPGDPAGQLGVTLANIEGLLQHVAARAALPAPPRLTGVKAYLREPEAAAGLRRGLRAHFGDQVPLVLLRGDICRRDLAIELEGVGER